MRRSDGGREVSHLRESFMSVVIVGNCCFIPWRHSRKHCKTHVLEFSQPVEEGAGVFIVTG